MSGPHLAHQLLVSCLLVLAACDLSLPILADAGTSGRDGAVDAAGDAPAADLAPDLQLRGPRLVNCNTPTVIDDAHIEALHEEAVSLDGLRVYASSYEPTQRWVVERSAVDQPFGLWAINQTPLASPEPDDPSIYRLGAVERVAGNSGPANQGRFLVDCELGGACGVAQRLTIPLPPGADGTDMDGPSVAVVGTSLWMAFNAGPSNVVQQLYVASKTASGWTSAEQLPAPLEVEKVDDPAISPDGLIVLASIAASAPTKQLELWQYSRATPDASFGGPEKLAAPINLPGKQASDPYLIAVPGQTAKLELFFVSDRGSHDGQLYHTVCEVD